MTTPYSLNTAIPMNTVVADFDYPIAVSNNAVDKYVNAFCDGDKRELPRDLHKYYIQPMCAAEKHFTLTECKNANLLCCDRGILGMRNGHKFTLYDGVNSLNILRTFVRCAQIKIIDGKYITVTESHDNEQTQPYTYIYEIMDDSIQQIQYFSQTRPLGELCIGNGLFYRISNQHLLINNGGTRSVSLPGIIADQCFVSATGCILSILRGPYTRIIFLDLENKFVSGFDIMLADLPNGIVGTIDKWTMRSGPTIYFGEYATYRTFDIIITQHPVVYNVVGFLLFDMYGVSLSIDYIIHFVTGVDYRDVYYKIYKRV